MKEKKEDTSLLSRRDHDDLEEQRINYKPKYPEVKDPLELFELLKVEYPEPINWPESKDTEWMWADMKKTRELLRQSLKEGKKK